MKVVILILIPILLVFSVVAQNNPSTIYQKLHLCKLPGITDSILCGTMPVYENRETKTGRIINLNIVIVPALHRDSISSPIFFFEGGPGSSAANDAPFFADTSIPYRRNHDIVLIDARGTGKSNGLNCPSLQVKQGLAEQFEDMYPKDAVKECYDLLSQQADLTQYTTTNIVNDIEDVRKWLGYGKINIYGLSYGTRVALVYMRLFPASIASCILWSPVPPYARMPLYHAKFAQNSINKVFDYCRQDSACNNSFPDVEREFNLLKKKTKNSPFTFLAQTSSGNPEQLSFSWDLFQTKLRTLLYTPAGIRKVPYIIHQTYIGNLDPFISLYPKGIDTANDITEGLYLCVTCAEDVPFIESKEINKLTKGTFMGDYRIDQQKNACALWVQGKIPDDFHKPVTADIPTLILSGKFDPVTPVSMAREIASHLPKSRLIIIPEMSHTIDGLSHPECFDSICLSFIDNPVQPLLQSDCIKEMKPERYRTGE